MAFDENDAAIVRSTIGLAHDLGLKVAADGVEDKAAWDLLNALGCDVAQSFYVSCPIPAGDLADWINAWNPRVSRVA